VHLRLGGCEVIETTHGPDVVIEADRRRGEQRADAGHADLVRARQGFDGRTLLGTSCKQQLVVLSAKELVV
jgi:hypothetical protein